MDTMTDKQMEILLKLVADKFEACKDMEEVGKAIQELTFPTPKGGGFLGAYGDPFLSTLSPKLRAVPSSSNGTLRSARPKTALIVP